MADEPYSASELAVERANVAAADKVSNTKAQHTAKRAGVPFGVLLKLGTLVTIIVREIIALATGGSISQDVTILGRTFTITVAPKA